jgi:hypothetical protein
MMLSVGEIDGSFGTSRQYLLCELGYKNFRELCP